MPANSDTPLISDTYPIFHPVTHVIFDMDGLLLNTEPHYTMASEIVCARYGHKFTWEMKQKQMGRNWDEFAQMMVDDLKLPITAGQYVYETRAIMRGLFPTAQLLPGVERFVRHLKAKNVPMAICTGSHKEDYEMKVKRYQHLFQLFGEQVLWTPDDPDVTFGKPAPDCYLVCAKRFFGPNLNPKDVLVFEDAPNGVQAALAAGMQVVMVPDDRIAPEIRAKATVAIKSLKEFQPEWFGLPQYEKDENFPIL